MTTSDQMLARISHVLFDLDGLLIDTETCYTIAFNKISQRYGKEFTWDLKTKCMGLTPDKSAQLVIQELDLPLTVNQLDEESHKEFAIAVKDVELMAGTEKLVKHLHSHDIPMAIATGSDRKHFDLKVAKHFDFFSKHFAYHVLAGEDPNVKRGKPFPDVFIEAMRKFGSDIRAQNVLVFEDSPLGVEAALAAGMPCVWVPDPQCVRSHLTATQILNSLEEFEPHLYGLPAYS